MSFIDLITLTKTTIHYESITINNQKGVDLVDNMTITEIASNNISPSETEISVEEKIENDFFCYSCDGVNENGSVNVPFSIFTQLPPPIANRKKKKKYPRMKFVSNKVNILDDDHHDGESNPIITSNRITTSIQISNLTNSSQALLAKSVLEPIKGVIAVSLHIDNQLVVDSKSVDIEYDLRMVSITDLLHTLRNVGLHATATSDNLEHDTSLQKNQYPENNSTVRSSLHVQGICCATEVPEVTDIIYSTSSTGIKKVSVNIPCKMVYVDHISDIVNAYDIAKDLNKAGFGASVRRNGGGRNMISNINDEFIGLDDIRLSSTDRKNSFTRLSNTEQYYESTLLLPTLTTMNDVETITNLFNRNQFTPYKIRSFYPNIPSHTLKIEHNPKLLSAPEVMDVLIQVGGFTDVSIYIDGEVEGLTLPNVEDNLNDDIHSYREIKNASQFNQFFSVFGLGLNIILSGAFWVICMIGELVTSWDHLKYAGLLSVLFGIPPVVVKAFRTMQRLHFDANCMMVIAAFGALALKEYDEAASVAFLFSISEYLEDKATRQARLALDSIVKLRPDHANLILSTGEIKIVPASILNIGSLVSVRTGDKIPTDGIIVEGSSEIDESSLTGESRPIDKCVNDVVSGGTINIGSTRLVVKTTSSVDDSAVSKLIRLVEEAQANRSPTELLVDNFAKSYTPVVLVAALFMCLVPWILGLDKDVCRRWSLNGLIIIVISCPCALTISTPVTYAAGLAATAQRGIIVKGGAKLEALGSVKTVIFDKTGTLTEGKFHMVHLKCISESKSREEILRVLAIMEAPSSHPLATTIVQSVKNEGIQIPKNCNMKSHSILKGEGVTAYIDGRATYVGNTRLFKRLGWYKNLKDEFVSDAEQWDREGGTVGFLGMEGIGILAMFSVADKLRSEAKEVVLSLQIDGIEVIMLTGDGDGAAKSIGNELSIPQENIHSSCLPEDKLSFVANMSGFESRKNGTNLCSKQELILLCGDGVNDAPALAVSDVGVAMGEGAALTMEISDVTLMDSNLTKLLYSMKVGRKVIITVKENIIFSIVTKVVVIIFTFLSEMTLLAAIATDVGVMLAVSINGMKLLPRGSGFMCSIRRKASSYDKISLELQNNLDLDIV